MSEKTARPSLEWSVESVHGFTRHFAQPKEGVRYAVVGADGEELRWTCFLTTGTSHKFTRAISDETDDLEAAKSACAFHWLNFDKLER